jgi:4-hydroxy-tetrahydrodipicolinate reductase
LALVDPRARIRSRKTSPRRVVVEKRGGSIVAMAASAEAAPVPIMVNDLTGKMGRAVADAVVKRGADRCFLVPVAFSGLDKEPVEIGGVEVVIENILNDDAGDKMEALKAKYPGLIAVDYTLPAAVNANAAFYVKHGVPFVMGTTGGDREKLLADAKDAKHFAVIAPQARSPHTGPHTTALAW